MTRAQPLPPEDRRAAIIAATVPLLVESGTEVSTRQIAAACGIAEGTLFRVFPTKEDLLNAAIHASSDPTEVISRLRGIDLAQPLPTRLRQVVDILQAHVRKVSGLFAALMRPRSGKPDPRRHKSHEHPHGPPDHKDRQLITDAIADTLAPDAELLDVDPLTAASFVRSVVTATTHPFLGDSRVSDPDLVTRLLLKALQKDPS